MSIELEHDELTISFPKRMTCSSLTVFNEISVTLSFT